MVTVTVEKRRGAAVVRARVTAASVERAVRLCGEGARLVFPIDADEFFTDRNATERANSVRRVRAGGVRRNGQREWRTKSSATPAKRRAA